MFCFDFTGWLTLYKFQEHPPSECPHVRLPMQSMSDTASPYKLHANKTRTIKMIQMKDMTLLNLSCCDNSDYCSTPSEGLGGSMS
jgi:hypothetical protein